MLAPGSVQSQATTIAERLDGRAVSAVHGYFAHQPAAVAAAVSRLTDLPYGFSAHALDARKTPTRDLERRSEEAAVVVACNHDVAAEITAVGRRPVLVRHGVDLSRFSPTDPTDQRPVRLLAVGRLVEKKGFDVLLDAVARIEGDVRLDLVGDGVLRDELAAQVDRLGLAGRVRLLGRLTHATLPALYAAADLVVVPSVVDRAGDRDGLPNVVLEAMASARPVVATTVAAIATAVRDQVTGVLVPPRDPAALAAAITGLVTDPARRTVLGRAGRRVAEQEFGLAQCGAELCRVLEQAYG